jgi:maltose alpha-D-glucosyltransferase/alpha-amylase
VSRELVTLEVSSFEAPLSGEAVSKIEEALPEYLGHQRWYRAKAKTVRALRVSDVVPSLEAQVLIVDVTYEGGDTDTYQIPVSIEAEAPETEILVRLRERSGAMKVLTGALSGAKFREALLQSITAQETFTGAKGRLAACRTSALDRDESATALESSVSRAEQSNSSIIYGDRYILKLFRKLESGINPDLEIGRYLTERRFKYTPPVLGEIVYQPEQGEPMHAAILQGFIRNQGDAWKFTLDSLTGFFERALQNGMAPALDSYHPLELAGEELPAIARQTIGEYIESARLLGNRTAQMHAALTDEKSGPDFAPEKFTSAYAEHLYDEMIDQADTTFGLLDDKKNMLSGEAADSAARLLKLQGEIRDRFSSLREAALKAVRIRHHGDYHLGQVLATGDDFIIIDFEGEPARPLAHRRIKTLAMRDVAGMVRSFSYAGYAVLFGLVPGIEVRDETRKQVEGWASFWGAWVSAEYLKSYFETAGNAPFVGPDPKEHRLLFDAFMLQKALYEVAYELNNRPGWVQIPLRGILDLIA